LANEETTPVAEETVASEDAPVSPATDDMTEDTTETAEPEATESEEAQPATAEAVEPELSTSLSPAEGASVETARADVSGGRDYETIFIVRVGEDPNAVTERIRGLIEQGGGVIDNVRISELRRLAYPIQKQIEGVYVVLNGRFSKETAAELDRVFKIDEAVLRHMTLREDQ